MKSALRYIIAAILTAGALFLAFRNQDFSELWAQLLEANLLALSLGSLLQLVAHFVRAWRWQYLLRPFKQHTNLYTAFKAVMVGYALNNVIPRAGEVARPLVVAKREHIPFTGTLGTIVLERVFDIIIVGALLFISYLLYADKLSQSFPELIDTTTPVIIIFIAGLTLFTAAVLNKTIYGAIERLINWIFPTKFASILTHLFRTFTDGLRGLNRKTAFPLIGGTILVWFLYWLSMLSFIYVFSGSDELSAIGISGTTLLLTLSAIAVAIPTPGGLGTYQYFISQTLILIFAVPSSKALAFATLSHIVPFIIVTIIGIVYAFTEGVGFKTNSQKQEEPRLRGSSE